MKIKLGDWLAREFQPPPAIRTARRWIKAGKIYPPAVKIGISYYVEEGAIFQGAIARPRLAERIPK
ncbi:hypothetical protein HDG34_005820 [Paraburkholderia sp. HC6.4b]|uniref:excisionase n=1 Tax=unclassified Paraburkholderia TaxID=2615204 RepID=UPI001617331E|nr:MULTISPECIES: excisionase [unclassified Paraburkholderia]MBB5411854.1 hypothetical protein [Paraburkholderia sp. HC6.4b]MBB5450166.1 hypothetical protein [Paraburkholderia sp. Kb1A]